MDRSATKAPAPLPQIPLRMTVSQLRVIGRPRRRTTNISETKNDAETLHSVAKPAECTVRTEGLDGEVQYRDLDCGES